MAGHDRLGRVLEATATLWVDGVRSGSAVLVDACHMLTAGHTLAAAKPDSKVGIEFPCQADPAPVTVVPYPRATAWMLRCCSSTTTRDGIRSCSVGPGDCPKRARRGAWPTPCTDRSWDRSQFGDSHSPDVSTSTNNG